MTFKDMSYIQYVTNDNPVTLKRLDFIIKEITNLARQHPSRTLKILDIGCGSGNISIPLASLGHRVTGVDINPEAVRECQRRNPFANTSFSQVSAESLDLGVKYDVIICSEVIEHTRDPQLIIQSIDRTLVNGGICILTLPNGYCLNELIFSRLLSQRGKSTWAYRSLRPIYRLFTGVSTSTSFPFCLDSLHQQFFSFSQLKNLLTLYSYTITTITHTDMGLPIPGAGRLKWLKKIECKLADLVPHFLAGGWLLSLKRGVAE